MKKLELFIMVAVIIFCYMIIWFVFIIPDYDYGARENTPTTVQFERDTIPLGVIKYGAQYKAVFRFANIGSAPLLIHDVETSCGCTSATWDRDPVKPGKSGEINIEYEPNSLGKFIKTIEVHCNTKENVINLKLSGSVTE